MADVAVLFPWRCDPAREAVFAWCLRRWADNHPDWQLVAGTDDPKAGPGDPWRKARAVAHAAAGTDAATLVVADADVWCQGAARSVAHVQTHSGWAVPHDEVRRLTEAATRQVVDAGVPPERFGAADLEEPPYTGVAGGGIVVLDRATWDRCPLDPRFEGWGGEDQSWGYALETLAGPAWRDVWPCWHLWHPPQPRLSRQTGSRANDQLRRRYKAARGRPDRMARLAAEATHNLTL